MRKKKNIPIKKKLYPKRVFDHTHKKLLIDSYDLVTILYHLHIASKDQTIGFNDSIHTLKEVEREFLFNRYFSISKLESALYSANMCDERGKFWSPQDLTFDQWLRKLKIDKLFDKRLNYLKQPGEDDDD